MPHTSARSSIRSTVRRNPDDERAPARLPPDRTAVDSCAQRRCFARNTGYPVMATHGRYGVCCFPRFHKETGILVRLSGEKREVRR